MFTSPIEWAREAEELLNGGKGLPQRNAILAAAGCTS